MTHYRERHYRSEDGLSLFYRDYDAPAGPARTPVLCIPGLTRNARDFDFIAGHIAAMRCVLVADLRGRGRSDYDPDPGHYAVPVEAGDMLSLLTQAKIARAVVLGTSRGGIVAMAMAAAKPEAVAGVILNDIGAVIEARGLQRIVDAVATPASFKTWEEAEAALRESCRPDFRNVSDAQWMAFTRALYREDDGRIVPDRDPLLLDAMLNPKDGKRAPIGALDLWPLYRAVGGIPVLLIRGRNSDLLSAETAEKMAEAKPDLSTVTVEDRGHVPFLDEPIAVDAIDRFLAKIA